MGNTVYPPPSRDGNNTLKKALDDERKLIQDQIVGELEEEQVLRPELEASLADELVQKFTHECLQFEPPYVVDQIGRDSYLETNPMYLGLSGEPVSRSVDVFTVRVPLVSAEAQWLTLWPPGSHPPLSEQVTYDSGLRAVTVKVLDDRRNDATGGGSNKTFLQQELSKFHRLVDTTNSALRAWNNELPTLCRDAVAKERARREKRRERQSALGLPVKSTATAPIPWPLPRRRAKSVKFSPQELQSLGGRPSLPFEDYAAVLNELQRAAGFFREHPSVSFGDDNARRDLVLAMLNAAFPGGATGETFTKLGKSDIRVVTGLASITGAGDSVFKAECKMWDGPKSAVEALKQLCERYLTWPETRTAILLFGKARDELPDIGRLAHERLSSEFEVSDEEHVAGWPTILIRNPPEVAGPIRVAIVSM
jgi:hypothetical protein